MIIDLLKTAVRWLRRKETEEKAKTGRRVPEWARVYGLQEMLDQLKAEKKQFFRMRSGGLYGVAVNKKTGEPVCFVRVDKDKSSPKLRKRARRALKQAQK